MQPQAQSKHLRLTATTPADLAKVQADPTRVHQILLNLLSNAIKFTPDGGSITMSARAVTAKTMPERDTHGGDEAVTETPDTGQARERREGGGFIEVSVQDTGVGIAPEDQPRLFQDFEQVAGGRYQGTGLGLSLTRRLVELHGGRVGLESTLGSGSRFWFTLPEEIPVYGTSEEERSNGSTHR